MAGLRKSAAFLLVGTLLLQISAALSQPVSNSGGLATLGVATVVSAAGTNQSTATLLTANVNIITSISANQGVKLSGSAPLQIVINAGSVAALVYPNSGATITGGGTTLATNAAFTINAGSSASFACSSSTACYASFSSFQ